MSTTYSPKRNNTAQRKKRESGAVHTTAKSRTGTARSPRRMSKKRQRIRRNRILLGTFLIFLLCLSVAAAIWLGPRGSQPETTDPPQQTDAAETLGTETVDTAVREYGELAEYHSASDGMQVRIRYPKGELNVLEDAIRAWIQQTVLRYASEIEKKELEQPAELTVDYESFRIGDKYINIRFLGQFRWPGQEQPEIVIKTFNVDSKTGQSVTMESCLDGIKPEWLQKTAAQKARASESDTGLVENWSITSNGIELLYAGDSLLVAPGESVTIRFTNEELAEIRENPPMDTSHIDPNKPVIALTFDDGPCRHTDRLLDAFAQYGGKATFFVVGNVIDERPETAKRIVAEGHEIASHSWSHKDLATLSADQIREQLMRTYEKIYEVTGYKSNTMRPPWGSVNDTVKAIAKECGISLILWSIDTEDWMLQDADKVYDSLMAQVKDGAIILMHDLHWTTVDAMERAIPDLIAQGYQLVTVSELLLYNGGSMQAGKVYGSR